MAVIFFICQHSSGAYVSALTWRLAPIDLHKRIYESRLADYLKKDIPFVPHITIGVFSGSIDKYPEALEEANRLDLDYHSVIDKLHLIKVNDDGSQIVWNREFSLLK